MIAKLLEQKPELTSEYIDEQIRLKKEKIGAGYLTDQGALFLIAADHAITLTNDAKTEMRIKDLYSGAKDVSLTVGIMGSSPALEFSKKNGDTFTLRTIILYDEDTAVSAKLWNEKANLPGIEELKPGDLVRVTKAYIKSDFEGLPTVHIGSNSDIKPITKAEAEINIPDVNMIIKDISQLREDKKYQAASGIIDGMVDVMEFTNSKGQPRKALKMRLRSQDNVSDDNGGSNDGNSNGSSNSDNSSTDGSSDTDSSTGNNKMRVILWNKDDTAVPNMISPNTKISLLGVKIKAGNQELEIHGSEATFIEIDGKGESEPIITRILSVIPATATPAEEASGGDSKKSLVLGVDSKKNLYQINDLSSSHGIVEGSVVEIMPSKAYGNSITLDENSFVRKLDDDKSIPSLSEVRTKISDIKIDNNYCIEAIILKAPERREVQTKAGDIVELVEAYVEDATAQIWVKGWRNQAMLMDKCKPGDIVSMTALNARAGLEGKTDLLLTQFSKITKKSDSQTQ